LEKAGRKEGSHAEIWKQAWPIWKVGKVGKVVKVQKVQKVQKVEKAPHMMMIEELEKVACWY